MKYRPEIDGLRAVAVVPVVLYHAGVTVFGIEPFQGGFVGVDIFFVISGYLIGSILLKEIAEGTFSFLNFYERRARRILPALFFVVALTVPFAWMYMLPAPFEEFSESIIATVLFGSNFYFLGQDSYAAEPSAFKPLLHTWSLAVEEQFYVLFPPFLLLCWKFARSHMMTILVLGLLVSLELADWTTAMSRNASFYLLPTRGWELAIGALLAKLELDRGRVSHPVLDAAMPAVGIFLIVHAVVLFDERMHHPGFGTVVPVAGAVFLIWFTGRGGLISDLLCSRVLVGTGLISYSLYLWHQPIFALVRIRTGRHQLTGFEIMALIALTLILAALTWVAVERPFRNRRAISKRAVWGSVSVSALALSTFGLAGNFREGFLGRVPERIREAVEAGVTPWTILEQDGRMCYDRPPADACVFGDAAARATWALVGDSHLAAISHLLLPELQLRGDRLVVLTKGACPYVPTLEVQVDGEPDDCTYEEGMQRREYLRRLPESIVILGGRLPLYLTGTRFDNGEGGVERTIPYRLEPMGGYRTEAQRKALVAEAIAASILELLEAGHKVVLIYPIPVIGVDVPSAVFRRQGEASESFLSIAYSAFKERAAGAYEIYDSIPDHPNLIRIYPEHLFCNTLVPGRCVAHDGEKVFFVDDDHLSASGAVLLIQEMLRTVHLEWGL